METKVFSQFLKIFFPKYTPRYIDYLEEISERLNVEAPGSPQEKKDYASQTIGAYQQ